MFNTGPFGRPFSSIEAERLEKEREASLEQRVAALESLVARGIITDLPKEKAPDET